MKILNKIPVLASALLWSLVAQAQVAYPLFQPSNGLMIGNVNTYVTTSAVAADVVDLFSGTCNNTTFLRGDGSCAAAGGGTVTSIAAGTGITASPSSPITTSGTLSVDQAFSPTWTGDHTWSSTSPSLSLFETDAAAGERLWRFDVDGNLYTVNWCNDAGMTCNPFVTATRFSYGIDPLRFDAQAIQAFANGSSLSLTGTVDLQSNAGITLTAGNVSTGVISLESLNADVDIVAASNLGLSAMAAVGISSLTSNIEISASNNLVIVAGGSATINSQNICLQDGTNCPTGYATLSGNQTFTGINAFSNASNTFTGAFTGNGSALTNLDAGDISAGTLAVARGGTGTTTSTGTGSTVLSASPTFTGTTTVATLAATAATVGGSNVCRADGTDCPSGGAFDGADVRRITTAQSLSVGSLTILLWNSEVRDTGSYHDNTTNSGRILFPQSTGNVQCMATVTLSGSSGVGSVDSVMGVGIRINGSTYVARTSDRSWNNSAGGFGFWSFTVVTPPLATASAADYAEVIDVSDSSFSTLSFSIDSQNSAAVSRFSCYAV